MNDEYLVTVGEEEYHVSVPTISHVRVNERDYAFDFTEVKERAYSLLLDGRSFQVSVLGQNDTNGVFGESQPLVLAVNGNDYVVTVDDKRSLLLKSFAATHPSHAGNLVLKSPMPGLVVKVEVQEGEVVQQGQGLVVLEAMKMENELKAAHPGTVTAIHVQAGVAVEKGQNLITISNG